MGNLVRLRCRFCCASSVLALAICSSPAFANCSPDPTIANTTTTCTGTDTDGIAVTTNGSTVTVQSGATVTNAGAAAISVAISSGSSDPFRTAAITIDGSVDGGSSAGIAVTNGTAVSGVYGPVGTRTAITVRSGGSVSGANAITVAPSASNPITYTLVDLDNSGSILATVGPALSVTSPFAGFSTITNRAGGLIMGISAPVGTITNAGTIDGGTRSAIDSSISGSYVYPGGIANSGSILSAGASATIANYSWTINNTGVIANSGTGSAIGASFATITNGAGSTITADAGDTVSVTGQLTVDNSGTISNTGGAIALKGGTISLNNLAGGTISASGTAISASTSLYLTNRGTITGNVFAGSTGSSYSPSVVDSIGGTIVGNLTFGASDDFLYATYSAGTGLSTGVTGTVDGGAGKDTVYVRFASDAALSSAIALPANFEVLGLAADAGTTLTLAQGFSGPANGIVLSGSGTLVNASALNADGTVVAGGGYSGNPASFTNTGTITSTGSSGNYAVNLGVASAFANSGTINSTGGGVNISPYSFDNSGTIAAAGTAVNAFIAGLPFSNSGMIQSTGGTGLVLAGSSYGPDLAPKNSGTVKGALVGVSLSTTLINTGLISSPNQAVQLGSYGVLDNRAGGVVTGGALAIAPAAGNTIFNAAVVNAGTINGDVSFASPYPSYYGNNNRFFALAGGMLNGNLTLGQGDTLITEIDNTGSGQFAGISGTVTASGSNLRYEVRAGTSATLAPPSGFVTVGYDLYGNAALKLSATGTINRPLSFAGTGSVDLTADMTASTQPAIIVTSPLTLYGYSSTASALSITSNGTITLNRADPYSYAGAAVVLGAADQFTNTGTIRVTDTSGATYNSLSAIQGGKITNTGTISVSQGDGVRGATSLDNSGSITAGGAAANLGYFNGSVSNSGTLASTTAAAVTAEYGYGSVIRNLAGGTISGGAGVAVTMGGGTVSNAGAINGSVDLGYSPYGRSYAAGTYIADGGTLNGNLSFGNGNDTLLVRNGETGVSGAIDPGAGVNTYGRFYRNDGSAVIGGMLPTGFQQELVEAIGGGTTVTLSGPGTVSTRDLQLAGDGSIVIDADISGRVLAASDATLATDGVGTLASLTNNGTLTGGVAGIVQSFTNKGTIRGSFSNLATLELSLTGPASITNSGTISSASVAPAIVLYAGPDSGVTFTNTGTINGNVFLTSGDDRFVEALSGTIAGTVDAGQGRDTLTFDLTGGGALSTGLYASFINFEDFSLTGSGTVTTDGPLPVQTLTLKSGTTFGLAAGSTLQTLGPVAITGSDGDDHVVNHGTIVGDVMLGGGNDSFDYYAGSSVSGIVDGGTGTDRLSFYLGGAATTPTPINSAGYANFEQLTLESGIGSLSGSVGFDTIAVNGGRLIGLGGSTIAAAHGITVASGATFGSAGTVNANLLVNGTLSPGASPGTMKVNGNITLAGGSTTLFEMTPTVSDALIISGKLTVQPGATLNITGSRPLTPGVTYDLITATAGIDGSFSTTNKASTVLGFLRQTQNALQLIGTLQFSSAANVQVAGTTAYINDALINGTATTGLYAALPSLVDANGYANGAAIATLDPQAYASASQIGFDNGLAIAAAVRAMPGGKQGLFAVGQGLGAWHVLQGDPVAGIARARQNMGGFVAGLGYGTGPFTVMAFAGRTNARQSLGSLAARTRADGTLVGGAFIFTTGGLDLGGSLTWEGTNADTVRSLFNGSVANSRYDLHTLTLDGHAGYAVSIGKTGWRVGPQLGLTYVRVSRGSAQETGAGAFSLDVAARVQHATFLDADLRLDMAPGTRWRPWISGGLRKRLDGNAIIASAGFTGIASQFSASGAPYGKDFAHVGAGFDYALTRQLTVFARGNDSFNRGTGVRDVTVGLRLGF